MRAVQANHSDSKYLRHAIRVVGHSREPGAAQWVLRFLRHSDNRVQDTAKAWYRDLDPQWRSKPDIRRAILESGTPNEGGGS